MSEPWRYCFRCVATGPTPECRLCAALNGREMTPGEAEELSQAVRKGHSEVMRQLFPADWWRDVPFADGTTPRGRS